MCPLIEAELGEFGALGVGIFEGLAKIIAAAAVELVTDCVGDELAAILFAAVDGFYEID